jgi:hypothetical protein
MHGADCNNENSEKNVGQESSKESTETRICNSLDDCNPNRESQEVDTFEAAQ